MSGNDALALTQCGWQWPQLQESTVAALWDAGLFAEGERIWGGFSKGTGTDQSTSPAPAWLLKNPPLLRFEKVFIVICWFCLGPVLRSVAGPERSGKTC